MPEKKIKKSKKLLIYGDNRASPTTELKGIRRGANGLNKAFYTPPRVCEIKYVNGHSFLSCNKENNYGQKEKADSQQPAKVVQK